jgi:hypothetical protein
MKLQLVVKFNSAFQFPGSSMVEHSAVNRRVASSNLARGAIPFNEFQISLCTKMVQLSVNCPCCHLLAGTFFLGKTITLSAVAVLRYVWIASDVTTQSSLLQLPRRSMLQALGDGGGTVEEA